MNQLFLRILLTDGTSLEIKTSAGDIVKWESHFDLPITDVTKQTHILYLAWLSATRIGKTGLAFEAWVDLVANVELDDPKE
jgi:hypothetical protein